MQADSLRSEPPGKPKNTGVGSLSPLQRIFLTQELNQGLLRCRPTLHQLSYQGIPFRHEGRVKETPLRQSTWLVTAKGEDHPRHSLYLEPKAGELEPGRQCSDSGRRLWRGSQGRGRRAGVRTPTSLASRRPDTASSPRTSTVAWLIEPVEKASLAARKHALGWGGRQNPALGPGSETQDRPLGLSEFQLALCSGCV